METRLKGRVLVRGLAEAKAMVSQQPLSFLGGVDPITGVVVERGNDLKGQKISGKILVFPYGKGSTVGSYTIFAMAKRGTQPAGIINTNSETIIATGCVIAGIPLMDKLEQDPTKMISNGDFVIMDAIKGVVMIKHSIAK